MRLARRQYDAVDPDNRLVAGELEHRWEVALRAEVEAQEAAARFAAAPTEPALDAVLRTQFRDVGHRLPALWASGRLRPVQQKALLRTLIRRIILARPRADRITIKVVWISGAFSVLEAHPPLQRAVDLPGYERLVERVLALAAAGVPDGEIARRLTAEGFRSARTFDRVPTRLVGLVRRRHGQPSLRERVRGQAQVDGQWTVTGLARALGVPRHWVTCRIAQGRLPTTRHPDGGYHFIPNDPALLAALQAEAAATQEHQRARRTDR